MKFTETIFITGFPGFIAGKLVKKLADEKTQFYLLVQSNFVEKAMAEVEKIAQEANVPLDNFALIKGDITQENLGIEKDDLDVVLEEITAVYHLAAIYDLEVKKELAYLVNVEGTKNVNNFVKKIKNLERYNYVSTCYVSGKRIGEIREDELEHQAGFRNFYEETKYWAEVEVEKLKEEIPLTIFRPSVVCGDSQTGETAKYDGIYYVIKYLQIFPSLLSLVNIGNDLVKLNLVPVDFVVDAMTVLAKDEAAKGKTVQLADSQPLSTAEVCDAIGGALAGKKSIIKIPPKLMERILMLPITPMISGLPHTGVPYFFVPQTYNTDFSRELLAKNGVVCPNFKSYVKVLINFMKKHPKL